MFHVLFNPSAGNGKGTLEADKVRQKLTDEGKESTPVDMTKISSYTEFFASLAFSDAVVLVGGDGTLHRFINDTDGLKIEQELYFFTSGTGNDFFRDIEKQPGELIDLKPYLEFLPTVTVNGETRKFINGIGFGIDGYCCEEGDRLRAIPGKKVDYTAIAIKGLLFFFKPATAEITVDGQTYTYKKAWLAPTMFGRYYGGGMIMAPGQDRLSKDGTVTCVTMYGNGRLHTLIVFPSVFKGEHLSHKNMVAAHTGREITVRFDRPIPLQIDGETVSGVTEYTVRSYR